MNATVRSRGATFSSEQISAARAKISAALAVEGYISNNTVCCPSCGERRGGTFAVFGGDRPGAKCHRCGFYLADAITFLTRPRVRDATDRRIRCVAQRVESQTVWYRQSGVADLLTVELGERYRLEGGDWSFPQAVAYLLGERVDPPAGRNLAAAAAIAEDNPGSFQAAFTEETVACYEMMLSLGDQREAQRFYGRFGISAEVVTAYQVTTITDLAAFGRAMLAAYTPAQLLEFGLGYGSHQDPTYRGAPWGYAAIDSRYCHIEPHLYPSTPHPAGRPTGAQFRGNETVEAAVTTHKAYKARVMEAERTGKRLEEPKVPYVSKVMSVKGAKNPAMRCGFGLPAVFAAVQQHRNALASAEPSGPQPTPPKVWIVEGCKDAMAGTELGLLTLGIPGARANTLTDDHCDLLAQCEVILALDGDAAGAEGRQLLAARLRAAGVAVTHRPPPPGKDMCDVLLDRVGRC